MTAGNLAVRRSDCRPSYGRGSGLRMAGFQAVWQQDIDAVRLAWACPLAANQAMLLQLRQSGLDAGKAFPQSLRYFSQRKDNKNAPLAVLPAVGL